MKTFIVDGESISIGEFRHLLETYVSSLVNIDEMTWNEQLDILEENGHNVVNLRGN